MFDGIQSLYNKYQQKYPLYSRDAIVEEMLNDGAITFEVAKKIKSGVSLFLIDNEQLFKPAKTNDIDITEILGGNFTRTQPETRFNRRIEPTKQPMTQGDCWLLSDINALSQTEWGRNAIYNAIIPDEDGSGGVTIIFKGSPLEQKEIHITAYQIEQARKSGNYSDGDDDMIAFELATEITFKEIVKQGLAARKEDDDYIQEMGGNYRSYIFAGITTDKFDQYPISELLGIKTKKVYISHMKEQSTAGKDVDNMLKYLAQHKTNISGWCAFTPFTDYGDKATKNYLHGGHAYSIKAVNYGKEVILTDPHYSDYDIKVPWKVFTEEVMDITFSFKDNKTEKEFNKNALPKNYEYNLKKSKKQNDELTKKLLESLNLHNT